jgi:threonine dehydrogenase-like Zn-dependent dehydrogenase
MIPLLRHIERGALDPVRIITHQMPLADAVKGYDIFKNKKDSCVKVVLKT